MGQTEDEVASLFRLLNEINIVAQLSSYAFEGVMVPDMTLPQFVVLNHLTRLGDNRTPLELARAMQVTKGAMTNTLQHLERKSYVVMRPNINDGRSKRVTLTAAGRSARQTAIDALRPELLAMAAAISSEKVLAVLPVLEEIRRYLDARRM